MGCIPVRGGNLTSGQLYRSIDANKTSGEICGANPSLNMYTDRGKTDSRKGSNTNICQKAELHIPLCDALLC